MKTRSITMRPENFRTTKLLLKRKKNGHLQQQAAEDAEKIINHIITNFPQLRIRQWGSLLQPGQFKDYSDIDIAVEGKITSTEFSTLLSDIDKMTEFPLDLVHLDAIHPEHASYILQNGVIVYEP